MPITQQEYFKKPEETVEQYNSRIASLRGDSSVINSDNIGPVTETNFVYPNQSPIYDVSKLVAPPLVETPSEKKAQSSVDYLQELNKMLVGESSYRVEAEKTQDIEGLTKTKTDLSNKLKILQNEALAIPQQLQIESEGRGITGGGLKPIETGRLRTNAIQALGVSALLEAANNNLTTAQTLADRAVAAKFDPIKEEISAVTANLDLILKSPDYTREEKNRAQEQLDIQNAKKAETEKAEKLSENLHATAIEAAKNGATSDVLTNILNSQSLDEALRYAGPSLGSAFIAKAQQQEFENRIALEKLSIDKAKIKSEQSGLSNFQQTKVQTIANQFDSEQAVKSYQIAAETIDAVKGASSSPLDDIQRIYAFAKVMDPNSVVREGEYKTVQDYSMALLEKTGIKTKRIFENTGFLSAEARLFMLKTLKNRLASSEKAYKNIYNEYGRRINKITGNDDGDEYLTDYSKPFTEEEQVEDISAAVKSAGYDYEAMKADGLSDEEIKKAIGL